MKHQGRPIVLVSYQIACQTYDDKATADLVKGWLSFVTGADGQEVAATDAGSAPLSEAVAEKVKAAVDSISAA